MLLTPRGRSSRRLRARFHLPHVAKRQVFFPFLDGLFVFAAAEVQLRKELRVGAYRLSSWFVAKTTAALLPYAVWPLLHVTILYWMAAVNPMGGAPFIVTLSLIHI